MFGKSKIMRNYIIFYLILFMVMALIVFNFLDRMLNMLEEQNTSIIEIQLQNIIDKAGKDISSNLEIAENICIDSKLTRKNLELKGNYAIDGIERMQVYKERMDIFSTIFLSYDGQKAITESGTCSLDTLFGTLFTEESVAMCYSFMEKKVPRIEFIVEGKDNKFLTILHYYPPSSYINEKWIGFVIEEEQIAKEIEEVSIALSTLHLVYWDGMELSRLNHLDSELIDKEWQLIGEMVSEGEKNDKFTLITTEADYCGLQVYTVLDNKELKGQLSSLKTGMLGTGLGVFLLLFIVMWLYERYRYHLLYDVKQYAVSNYLEGDINDNDNDYVIIRNVLQRNFEKIKKQNQDFEAFQEMAKKQLTWILLSSTPPGDMSIQTMIEMFDMPEGGLYYSVIDMIMDDAFTEKDMIKNHPYIMMHYVAEIEEQKILIMVLILKTRDDSHEERMSIITDIRSRLLAQGCECGSVSCGLVYQSIRELHYSQQEALTIIQTHKNPKANSVIFFDEKVHVSKLVPHITSDLLEEFRDNLHQGKISKLEHNLTALMAPPSNMASDLLVYVRYKLIQILMEEAGSKGVQKSQQGDFTELMNLEEKEFKTRVLELAGHVNGIAHKNKVEADSVDADTVVSFLKQNFSNPDISVSMVAEHLGISTRSVSRMMRKAKNKSYNEYIQELRLKKSCELLETTEKGVPEIVQLVGYYDMSSFYRLFKERFEMTPVEYRNQKGVKQRETEK